MNINVQVTKMNVHKRCTSYGYGGPSTPQQAHQSIHQKWEIKITTCICIQ